MPVKKSGKRKASSRSVETQDAPRATKSRRTRQSGASTMRMADSRSRSRSKKKESFTDDDDDDDDDEDGEDEDEYKTSSDNGSAYDDSDEYEIENQEEEEDEEEEFKESRVPVRQRKSKSDVSYTDDTINPDTMQYLRELGKNNNRDWFHGNKDIYKVALEDFKSFSSVLQEKVTEVDWTVPILPLEKHNLFRIFRDIRFSASKIPFKEYFSVAFSRTGKQGLYAKYYISVQPGDQSFIGGGLWHPEATHISLMRREIDKHPNRLKDILALPDFYGNFLDPTAPGKAKKPKTSKAIKDIALQRFIERNSEDALKTAPKGYDKAHPDIDLLRLKSYTVGKRISDSEIIMPNAMDYLVEIIRALEPFITYLNGVVMPDLGLGQDASNTANDNGDSDED